MDESSRETEYGGFFIHKGELATIKWDVIPNIVFLTCFLEEKGWKVKNQRSRLNFSEFCSVFKKKTRLKEKTKEKESKDMKKEKKDMTVPKEKKEAISVQTHISKVIIVNQNNFFLNNAYKCIINVILERDQRTYQRNS